MRAISALASNLMAALDKIHNLGWLLICQKSNEMAPLEVVDMLRNIFSCFDALCCDKHGVSKLETIGKLLSVISNITPL